MQKTTTLKDFKVFMFKTFLTILVLGISFQVSFAQNPVKAAKGFDRSKQPAVTPVLTNEQVKAAQKKVQLTAPSVTTKVISATK